MVNSLLDPLIRISQFFDAGFCAPKLHKPKIGSITNASRKTFLVQEALAL